jgi:hypothetical protein
MISERIVSEVRAASECTEVTPGNRRELKYPKLIPLFHFTVRQYRCPFGNLLTMDTDAMGGKMLLSTVVFTPDTGRSLPVLLIDSMDMKKKSLMYAEYYDCTVSGVQCFRQAIRRKRNFPDFRITRKSRRGTSKDGCPVP